MAGEGVGARDNAAEGELPEPQDYHFLLLLETLIDFSPRTYRENDGKLAQIRIRENENTPNVTWLISRYLCVLRSFPSKSSTKKKKIHFVRSFLCKKPRLGQLFNVSNSFSW